MIGVEQHLFKPISYIKVSSSSRPFISTVITLVLVHRCSFIYIIVSDAAAAQPLQSKTERVQEATEDIFSVR